MKYIIDIPDDVEWIQVCKRAEGGVLMGKVIYHSDFMPYTEPDRKTIEDEVWSLVRIIETMSVREITNIFDVQEVTVPFLCNALTYQEAKDKYEAWLKQNDILYRQNIQPVPSGKWIDTGSGQECSVCGEIQYGYDTGRHYCPYCGCKMDGIGHD